MACAFLFSRVIALVPDYVGVFAKNTNARRKRAKERDRKKEIRSVPELSEP